MHDACSKLHRATRRRGWFVRSRKSRLSANHTDMWWEIQGQRGKGASTTAGPYTCARVTGHCNTYGNAVTQRLAMPQQIIRASVETAQVRLSMLSFPHQPHFPFTTHPSQNKNASFLRNENKVREFEFSPCSTSA